MASNPLINGVNRRGSGIFSNDRLQQIWNDTVVPELDETHSIVAVGSFTNTGVRAAIIFRKPVQMLNLKGEWIVEGAFLHDWTGAQDEEAKVLFKI